MKIGFVFDDSLDTSDGVQQYILTLGGWLSDAGHEVHYLVGQTLRNDKEHIYSMARNIKVRFNHNNLSIPLLASKSGIRQHFKQQTYDILHVQLPYSPQFAERVILAAPAETAIVGTFHILPFSAKEKLGTRILAKLLFRSLPRFDSIISVSEPAQCFARQYFGVESAIIPNPISLSRFQQHKKQIKVTSKHIIFLGRLVDRKGIMQFLAAVAELTKSSALDFRVTVAGTGPLKTKVHSYIQQHNLENIVQCIGYIDEKDKPILLGSADIAVFPSLNGESFGIVLTEAMAAGAGVVTGGNNPGYSSVLEYDDVLFDPEKTTEFADLIERLLTNSELNKTIHKRQQKQVKKYDLPVIGRDIEQLYKDAIAKRTKSINNKY